MEEIQAVERVPEAKFYIEWNGEKKLIGDCYRVGDMLRSLTILGLKEFKIFSE
jgi:hypothetical protein